MKTQVGEGETSVYDFAVDFGDELLYIGKKSYPKGHFATSVLNISKDTNTEMLTVTAPLFQVWNDMHKQEFTDAFFEKAKAAMLQAKEIIFPIEPFCLLDIEAENRRIDVLLSDEAKLRLSEAQYLVDVEEEKLSEQEKAFMKKAPLLVRRYMDMLKFYMYIPHDITNFSNAILNLELHYLRELEKRDENSFARACDEYFSDKFWWLYMFAYQLTPAVEGFTLKPNIVQEIVVVPHPEKEDKLVFARRLHFYRIMDFLVTDFFEGLHVGHCPRRCEICGRYFLTTDGRHQKYCNGYAPNDSKHRTCRAVGNRISREARESSKDHPAKVIYERRCNTINTHRRQGRITDDFAVTAKRIAKDKLHRAISDNDYFTDRYEEEMSQKNIYLEVELKSDRQKEKSCTLIPM